MSEVGCEINKVSIAVLQERVDKMEGFVDEMRTNHLPHIYSGINDMKVQMAYYIGGGTAIVVLVQFVIAIMF